jgi:hypothetical protein
MAVLLLAVDVTKSSASPLVINELYGLPVLFIKLSMYKIVEPETNAYVLDVADHAYAVGDAPTLIEAVVNEVPLNVQTEVAVPLPPNKVIYAPL